MRDWQEASAFALSLPGTLLSTSYGTPAVKIAANGRTFMVTSREAATSFGIALDLDRIEMLIETDPDIFWQTAHYVGWAVVLVRYGAVDTERVRSVIEQSRDWSAARPPVKSRKR